MDWYMEGMKSACLRTILIILVAAWVRVSASPVMSIDLGSEYIKIGIVKSGLGMEIALNTESSRKTRSVVAFRDDEREFASEAETIALKTPENAVGYLMQILGHKFDDPEVQRYRERFPYYKLLKDRSRGTVLFQINGKRNFSAEEIFAMILNKAKEYARSFTQTEVTDAVLTVPVYYNQAERRAVLTAARLAGINVLHVMSDNAAVALNYGVSRYKSLKTRMHYYMFYDMGASSTVATIVGYNMEKVTLNDFISRVPQLKIVGVGFDRNLGGLDFTKRLRDHLVKIFNSQNETAQKVEESNRAMAKLWKEAERVKIVLSANAHHHAQVENLLNQKDFRAPVTRAVFEQISQDLFGRVTEPISAALKSANLSMSNITEVILMGGATRMPKVQNLIMNHLGRSELGKSINTDEAAALGAAYRAASYSVGFRIKPFIVIEGNIFPISVVYETNSTPGNNGKPVKARHMLFEHMYPYHKEKTLTFLNHTKDFSFNVSYGDLDFLSETDMKKPTDIGQSFRNPLISRYTLTGVEEAIAIFTDNEPATGIQVHFYLNESGIITVNGVSCVFGDYSVVNETGVPNEADANREFADILTDDSTKNGSESGELQHEESVMSQQHESVELQQKESVESQQQESVESQQQLDTGKSTDVQAGTVGTNILNEKTQDAGPTKSQKMAAKVVNITELIRIRHENLDIKDMTKKEIKAAKGRLENMERHDTDKEELDKAKNELQSFITDYEDKLNQESYILCSTEAERRVLHDLLKGAALWFMEHKDDYDKSGFSHQLEVLMNASENITMRVHEISKREGSLEVLDQCLAAADKVILEMHMAQSTTTEFLEKEIKELEKLIKKTKQWRDKKIMAQQKLQPHENPAFTSQEVKSKVQTIVTRLTIFKDQIMAARAEHDGDGMGFEGQNAEGTNVGQGLGSVGGGLGGGGIGGGGLGGGLGGGGLGGGRQTGGRKSDGGRLRDSGKAGPGVKKVNMTDNTNQSQSANISAKSDLRSKSKKVKSEL